MSVLGKMNGKMGKRGSSGTSSCTANNNCNNSEKKHSVLDESTSTTVTAIFGSSEDPSSRSSRSSSSSPDPKAAVSDETSNESEEVYAGDDDSSSSSADDNSSSSNNNPAAETETETASSASKSVGFSTLTIRQYGMILGDNVTLSGPPISISWEHEKEEMYDVDDYEAVYESTRRSHAELKMPSTHRDEMMRRSGFSRREIQEAVKQSTIARNRRKRTAETHQLHKIQEAMENVLRSGKKSLRISRRASDDSLVKKNKSKPPRRSRNSL